MIEISMIGYNLILILYSMLHIKTIFGEKVNKPDFCDANYVDAAFNIDDRKFLIRDQWFWTFNISMQLGLAQSQSEILNGNHLISLLFHK